MADVPSSLQTIDTQEVSYRSALSESTLNKIGGTINALIKNGSESLGTIVQSMLTESQFQTIRGTGWVRMKNQNIVGSDLEILTGITNLPNPVNGTTFVQTDTDGNIGDATAGENKSHKHTMQSLQYEYDGGQVGGDGFSTYGGNVAETPVFVDANTSAYRITYQGGANNLAAGIKINFFIKINL